MASSKGLNWLATAIPDILSRTQFLGPWHQSQRILQHPSLKGHIVDQQDRNFVQMLLVVVGALFAFMVIIIIAAKVITGMDNTDKSQDPMVQAAVAERIQPVASVNIGAAPAPAPAASGAADGASVYKQSCAACHGTGAAGAPKMGDKGAWKARIGQGMNTLFDHAINGFKGMPAKGGNASLSDDAVKAAVKYMADNSK